MMVSICTNLFKKIFAWLLLVLMIQSCTGKKIFYKSDCDNNQVFKHVGLTQLLDSMDYYNNQYVEVSGKYKQGKDQSALVNDSTFVDHSANNALWVEFTPDCPLYLEGTRIGFFDYDNNDGKLTPANNKIITLRGKINARYKGNLNAYRGTIEHISYIKM